MILNESAGVPLSLVDLADNAGEYVFKTLKEKGLFDTIREFQKIFPGNRNIQEFPVERIDLRISQREANNLKKAYVAEGSYSPSSMKINDDGTVQFSFNINTSYNEEFLDNNESEIMKLCLEEIQGLFYHELLHAYEDFKIRQKDSLKELMHDKQFIFSSVASAMVHKMTSRNAEIIKSGTGADIFDEHLISFIFYIYSSASFENRARITQTYAFIKNVNDPKDRETIVKNTQAWTLATQLEKFNGEKFYEYLVKRYGEDPVKEVIYKITDKVNDALGEISSERMETAFSVINPRAQMDAVKKTLQSVNEHEEYYAKLSKKNPHAFIMYWSRKFNREGISAKRKLAKLTTL
jgi:hypothetical protein